MKKPFLLLPILFLISWGCEEAEDCAGVPGGSASIDDCGMCTGGTTLLEPNFIKDCAGDCGGFATVDSCGICDDNQFNNCDQDCNGEWGGEATVDCANECGGNAQELTYYWDADGDGLGSDYSSIFCDAFVEDNWVLNSDDANDEIYCLSNSIDECGICDGDGYSEVCVGSDECENMDCAGVCGGSNTVDGCGVCGGGGYNDDGYFCGDIKALEDIIITNTSFPSMDPLMLGNQTWLDGRLTKLIINDAELSGALSESIGNLTSLVRLSLNENDLTGLPERIGKLSNLVSLSITKNYDLTALPDSIGYLPNLDSLDFWFSGLTSLPESIGYLSNLTYLKLTSCELNSLPESIGNLTSLKKLHLSYNSLLNIPESISDITNLFFLSLTDNQLSSVPESIGNLINLYSLYLGDNQLQSIPESIVNLTDLQVLSLESNNLTSLPEDICNLNLPNFDVSGNQLCEEFHFNCIELWDTDKWGYSNPQDQSNCCEGPDGQENWTQCP